jgi:hypothetical protein
MSVPRKYDETQSFEVRTLGDLDRVAEAVGLPVGPRKGRSKAKKEWYVLLGFMKEAIPSGMFELPITVRYGIPPNEPDFVVARGDTTVGLVEVTEATDEADQKGMTAFERSEKSAALVGEFGGRFADGASRPGLAWAADIVDAIRRKDGKAIFQNLPTRRHLLVYPNSNASFLLFDEDDEREAVDYLRAEVAKDSALSNLVNGCVVHVLGGYLVCVDALGEARLLARSSGVGPGG